MYIHNIYIYHGLLLTTLHVCILYNICKYQYICAGWYVVDLICKFIEFHEAVGDKYRTEPFRFFAYLRETNLG